MTGSGIPICCFTYTPGRGTKLADKLFTGIHEGAVRMQRSRKTSEVQSEASGKAAPIRNGPSVTESITDAQRSLENERKIIEMPDEIGDPLFV